MAPQPHAFRDENLAARIEGLSGGSVRICNLGSATRQGDARLAAVLEQMGIVYTRMGVTEEAIKMYRRALEKDPSRRYSTADEMLQELVNLSR